MHRLPIQRVVLLPGKKVFLMINSIKARHSVFKAEWTGFVLFGYFLFVPGIAHAQMISDFINNLWLNTSIIPMTIDTLAYITGLFALYSGLMALKQTTQEPAKNPIKNAVIRLIIAATLISLPRTITVVTRSMNNGSLSAMPNVTPTTLMTGIPP